MAPILLHELSQLGFSVVCIESKQAYQAAIIQEHAADQAAAQWFFTGGPVTCDGKTYLPGLQ